MPDPSAHSPLTATLPSPATHGRHCTCSACAREDWTNPNLGACGMHGPGCPAVYDPYGPDRLVYVVQQTLTETFYFTPSEIAESFAWDEIKDHYAGTFEDFVIETFEQHQGSQFHDKWFYNDANPQVSTEIIARLDDE